MPYAAIRISDEEGMKSALGSFAFMEESYRARFVLACLRIPFTGEDVFYIGGNYARTTKPDYGRQILTLSELDRLFIYRRLLAHEWFPVSLKEENEKKLPGRIKPEMIRWEGEQLLKTGK